MKNAELTNENAEKDSNVNKLIPLYIKYSILFFCTPAIFCVIFRKQDLRKLMTPTQNKTQQKQRLNFKGTSTDI